MPARTYSEEEVAELLRRAAEMQAQGGFGSSERPGLSLEELTAIAAEAGLDPAHVRLAAAEMEPRARRPRVGVHPSKREVSLDRWVPGTLSDEAKEDIVAELRHRFDTSSSYDMGMGSYGKSIVQTTGRSLEWEHVHPWWGTQTRVLVQPRAEGVRIRVSQSNAWSGASTGWSPYYGPMLALAAGFVSAPVLGSYVLGILVALLTLVVVTPLVISLGRSAADRQRREVERLADQIVTHVAPLPVQEGRSRAWESSPAEPRLEILEGERQDETAEARGRLRER
jgi:hypothetical protein